MDGGDDGNGVNVAKETMEGDRRNAKETMEGDRRNAKETMEGDRRNAKETMEGDRRNAKETMDGHRRKDTEEEKKIIDVKILRETLAKLPDAPTVEDYAERPVEGYGKAILQAMGYKEGMAIGKRNQNKPDVKGRQYRGRRFS